MIELIPAIDMIDGKCVRLTQGDYDTKKVYNEDPLEVAKMFEDHGIRRLHVVDLDGARQGRIINYRTLERLATRTSLIIDFRGRAETGRRPGNSFRKRCADGYGRKHRREEPGSVHLLDHQVRSGENHPRSRCQR